MLVDTKRFLSSDGVSLEKFEVGQKLMILMDPPRHTWHRKVMSHMFTPRVIANLEPGIRATCVRLLDDLRDRDEFDVVEDFSSQLPMYVIAELIGLPDEYRRTAQRLSHLTAQRVSSNAAPEAAIAASLELNDYLLEETKRRRQNLGDDLISTIMTTPMVDDTGTEHYLDDEQIAAFFFEFTFAGNDTTTRSIANVVVGLSWYPDQRHELVADPSLIPNGVEELVRWDTPSHYLGRTTCRGRRAAVRHHPVGLHRRGGAGVRQPRRAHVRGTGAARHPSALRSQARVRDRSPRVHRRRARPVGTPHRVRGIPGPVPRLPRRRHRLRPGSCPVRTVGCSICPWSSTAPRQPAAV